MKCDRAQVLTCSTSGLRKTRLRIFTAAHIVHRAHRAHQAHQAQNGLKKSNRDIYTYTMVQDNIEQEMQYMKEKKWMYLVAQLLCRLGSRGFAWRGSCRGGTLGGGCNDV